MDSAYNSCHHPNNFTNFHQPSSPTNSMMQLQGNANMAQAEMARNQMKDFVCPRMCLPQSMLENTFNPHNLPPKLWGSNNMSPNPQFPPSNHSMCPIPKLSPPNHPFSGHQQVVPQNANVCQLHQNHHYAPQTQNEPAHMNPRNTQHQVPRYNTENVNRSCGSDRTSNTNQMQQRMCLKESHSSTDNQYIEPIGHFNREKFINNPGSTGDSKGHNNLCHCNLRESSTPLIDDNRSMSDIQPVVTHGGCVKSNGLQGIKAKYYSSNTRAWVIGPPKKTAK